LIQNSGSKWKIQIKYSKNTRPKLEVKPWGILVTLPEGVDENEAYRIIERHKLWIEEKHAELLEALERSRNIELIERSKTEFRELVEKLVEQATKDVLGMNPCRIVVRRMKSRWASCTPKGTITINTLARHLPNHLVSYIIYHEICHIIEPRHNKAFWACIQKHCPNYKELEKELLVYEVKLGLHVSTETA
jgi:hypothetical protein